MNATADEQPLDLIRYTTTPTELTSPEVLARNRVIMGLYNDPRADIFRVLRTHVIRQLRENNWSSFAVTSATPGAGKTLVALNLAIAIALEGNQSVLLVDGDFRNPSIGSYLGLEWELGLLDYLERDISLEGLFINPGIERLVVLPGSIESGHYASELISSQKMTRMIDDIKSRYPSRIIIFDLPPLFVADEALLFMPYVDAALLVVEDGKNSAEELQQSMHLLEQTNLLGLVLNKSTQPQPVYQYGRMVS